MDLINELKKMLEAAFPTSKVDLEYITPANRVFGAIEWDGFAGLEQTTRQSQLWAILDRQLDPAKRSRIMGLLTLTPAEMTVERFD